MELRPPWLQPQFQVEWISLVHSQPGLSTAGVNHQVNIFWLVVWNIFGTFLFFFPYIGNFIIPTDKLIFFRGVGIPPSQHIALILILGRLLWRLPATDPKSWETKTKNAVSSIGSVGYIYIYTQYYIIIKGSLGGETSVLRTFRMSGKELVKERVSKEKELVRERVSQRKS